MRWGKLSRASVSHPLCRAQGTFVYQRFAFPSPCELPSSASKSQITTPRILLCVELKMVFKVDWQPFWWVTQFPSVQFSCSVMSDSFQPHESQHARPPCPSPTPGVHSNSCPSSRWCHPAILSSVVPFFSCPQSLPASVFSNDSTLRMRWPKYWSFSFSIIPSKEHPGLISFRMDWLDLLAVQGTLRSLLGLSYVCMLFNFCLILPVNLSHVNLILRPVRRT